MTTLGYIILGIIGILAIWYMIKSNKKISALREEIEDELKIIK